MIKCSNLSKCFSKRKVLNDISLNLPNKGMVAIVGASGCGKSTLLNIFSGLEDYEGSLFVNGVELNKLNENQLDNFRLSNFGFVFQDFKLFEKDTVKNNILLPLETINNGHRKRKNRKANDLIDLVNLKGKEKQLVKNLSGGEKQRCAIARALVNEPKIIFADEPTAALDDNNSHQILNILKRVSQKSLVLIVSHDLNLIKQYVDRIIYLSDGVVIKDEALSDYTKEMLFPICKNSSKKKKQNLEPRFLFNHASASLKQKKWRTMFVSSITSFGLIGVGLSITLTSIISSNIKNTYRDIIDDKTVAISIKNSHESIYEDEAGSVYEAYELANKYREYVEGVGICYKADMESFFPDSNHMNLFTDSYRYTFNELSIRDINEFKWLDVEKPLVLPKPISHLENDEMILGLTYQMVTEICFYLRIERTLESLKEYFINNYLEVSFEVSNEAWNFYQEHRFYVVGFLLEKTPMIYHSNHLWNEYVYEELFRFPIKEKVNNLDKYIWSFSKIPFIHTKGENYKFLHHSRNDIILDEYLLEIASEKEYPKLYKNELVSEINRLLFYVNKIKHIQPRLKSYFQDITKNTTNYITSSNKGYLFYPSQIISGFSNMMYFSLNKDLLDKAIDETSNIQLSSNESQLLPKHVLAGYYANTDKKNVKFKEIPNNYDDFTLNFNVNHIYVSKGLAQEIGINLSSKDVLLNVGIAQKENIDNVGNIKRDFITIQLLIKGVIDDNGFYIYQNDDWLLTFFQSIVGFSIKDILPQTVSFSLADSSDLNEALNKLKVAFPDFEITHPFSYINNSIKSVCDILTTILLILAFLASIISCLLLVLSSNLHINETSKDIGLARCLGINKKEAKKFVYYYVFLNCFFSLILSVIELLVMALGLSWIMSSSTGGNLVVNINPLSFVAMSLLAVSISLISSLVVSGKIVKKKPLDLLKAQFI